MNFRRVIFLLSVMLLVCSVCSAQSKKNKQVAPSYAWSVVQPLGLHEPSTIDTLEVNYYRQSIPSAISSAWACTGNLGAEGINMIISERPSASEFFFRDALVSWIPTLDKLKFYNTRIPMTLMSYNTGGGRENAQDRLQGTFSGNINSRAQIGAMLDYLYSKGSYTAQATKDLSWGFSGSYIGERYEFQGSYVHYNLLNKENGGIVNDLYITDPAEMQGGVTSIDPKSIPVRLNDAHTRLVGGQLYLNHRYKLGYWDEQPVNDTLVSRTFVPVTSFVWTLDYSNDRHLFIDSNPSEMKSFFSDNYLSNTLTKDQTSHWALTNTFGISLLEGFHRYAKFGLSAYATHQIRRFVQNPDSIDHAFSLDLGLSPFPEGYVPVSPRATQNLLWAGAQLTKQKGSLLTYEATGRLGIAGPVAGDLLIDGNVSTRFRLLGDTVSIKGYGRFSNEEAPYLMQNYVSNHFVWHNDFGKERRLRFGGSLDIPHTGTNIDVSAQNLQNLLYFGNDCLPAQNGGSIQVFSATLSQKLSLGILHFDNRVTYQTTSNPDVLPLPKLAIYSNLYLLCRIATLHLQLGIDCDYYTRYYGLAYQPALASFHTQNEVQVGNYPFMNFYANMKLGKTRFYVMFSHVNCGLMDKNYFSLPHYPLNPRRFQLGLSVDFAN